MKTLNFFCVLCLISFSIVAQNVALTSGPEFNNPDPNNFWTQNLGTDETGHYLIRDIGPSSNPKIILEKYDFNFQLVYSKDIESSSGIMGDSKNHFKTILGNGELLVFLASWNKEKSEGGLWVKRFSQEGDPMGDEIQLKSDLDESILKSSSYIISLSEDGKNLAVLSEPTFDKNAMESIELSIFNTSDFKQVIKKEFKFEVEMQRYPRNKVFISNEGVAFAFKEVKVSGKEFKYYLASLSANTNFQEELNFNEDQLNQSKFIINKGGELVGVGILAELKKYSTLWQKTWLFKANSNGIEQTKIEPLGSKILANFMNEKKAASEGASINYFVLKDLLEKPNGGYLLITENIDQRKTSIPTEAPNQQPSYNYSFNYGGVIIISSSENCSIDWSTFFNKKQKTETLNPELEFGSFAYGVNKNQLHLIWNNTEVQSTISFPKLHWIDKSGSKIAVQDVFGNEAIYPTFLSSINLSDGSLHYTERTFSSLPLKDIQRENNFPMAADPSIFFSSEKGIIILSRMSGEMPKKLKFTRISFD